MTVLRVAALIVAGAVAWVGLGVGICFALFGPNKRKDPR